jgi:PAS domain S-box-containing protein
MTMSGRVRRRSAQELAAMGNELLLSEFNETVEELDVAEAELRAQRDELQRAQMTLLREREHYSTMLELAPVPYVATDGAGTITDANQAAARLFGCRQASLNGRPLALFTEKRSRRRLRVMLHDLAALRDVVRVHLDLSTRTKGVRRVEAIVASIRDTDGRLSGLRWTFVDQTRRVAHDRRRAARAAQLESLVAQRTEELEDANRTKDRLIDTVSHELRTALSAIGGYAELLELGIRGPMPDVQLHDVRRIRHAYDHIARIVDDLLSYSRLMSGQLEIDISDVVTSDALVGLEDLVAPQAAQKGLAIELGPCPTTIIRADVARVRQILLNVLGNAVKFTAPGGRVTVTTREETARVVFEVRDSGQGIPDDKIDAVFEPFVRLRTTATQPGTGLGLPISRDLARAMGGDLTVSSEVGHGSCFVLTLPRSTTSAALER